MHRFAPILIAALMAAPVALVAAVFDDVHQAVAVIRPLDGGGDITGTVLFKQVPDDDHSHVIVTAHVEGLQPNSTHAIHIHEFGDATLADGTSAGGHYNPAGHDHGLPDEDHRHAGDLGNLQADSDGVANLRLEVDNFSIAGPHHPILGRAVIIHAKKDDGGQPTGNAGPRIGIGVIGIAHSTTESE
jgi:Cu-Zn family superoxide dismutase